MAFDGLFTYAMTKELANQLDTGRITKIYQPSNFEILLHIRAGRQNHKLLLCAHPSYARVQLTNHTYHSPQAPPTFCMFLRKHLEGGMIENIHQVDMERIIEINIRSRNEVGDESTKTLLIEVMGRHSNIILLDDQRKILAALKTLSSNVNRHRTVAPGFSYVAPPEQNKVNPFAVTEAEFLALIDTKEETWHQIMERVAGISPNIAREIVFQGETSNIGQSFSHVRSLFQNNVTPQMITTENKEIFSAIPLTFLQGESHAYTSLSELLDRFFFGKAERDRVKQQINDLERFIANELAKNKKKDKKLRVALNKAEKADKFQKLGELVTANIHAISKGDIEVKVLDYYDEAGGTVTITLDPMKTPAENAQSYFHKYQKAKNAVIHIEEQLKLNEEEIAYFDSLYQQIESATGKDVEEIREELAEEGYLKLRKRNKQKKPSKPVIETYISSDGVEILVGKNNKQNEYITNKVANRDDIWLHTKDIPGSHVVIRSKEPSKQTLLEAANLAGYFSKGRQSSAVPVDYTKIRHVKKPSGAKPGMVIYTHQQTVYVTPDEESVWRLQKK